MALLSPYDLRRIFLGALLDAGAGIATGHTFMRHNDANPTARDDRRGERVKRHAVRRLHGPSQRRTRSQGRAAADRDGKGQSW